MVEETPMHELERRKTIAVFCSANDVAPKYMDAAREFGELMTQNGYDLVWGGSNKGVMKLVADTVQQQGGKIFGITMKDLESQKRDNADEMIVTATLGERLSHLQERGSAIVVMPGGYGTINEASHILEHKKHGRHNKSIIFLDTDGYWDGLKTQFKRMIADGFGQELAFFADTPQEAIDYINSQLAQ